MVVKLKVSPVKAHKRCVKIAFYIEVNCIDLIKINALMQIHLMVLFFKAFYCVMGFSLLKYLLPNLSYPAKH